MNLPSPVQTGVDWIAGAPGNAVSSLLGIVDDNPDGGLGLVMSALSGVAAALAVAIMLAVYFRTGYRSRRDVLRHSLAAAAVLALLAFVAWDMRHAAMAYLDVNPANPASNLKYACPGRREFHHFHIRPGYDRARRKPRMPEFRLTQISDTHLARRLKPHRQLSPRQRIYRRHAARSRHQQRRPRLRCADQSGRSRLRQANCTPPFRSPCRYLPGNHDIGDNPTAIGPAPAHPVTRTKPAGFRRTYRRRPLALRGRRLVLHRPQLAGDEHGPCQRGRAVRLAGSELARTHGKPVALFLHKPLFLNTPDDPELAATAIRYVPQPARGRLIKMLGAVDLRLIASGHVHQRRDFTYRRIRHVWAPSVGFIIPDRKQEVIGIKEVGLVEYRFQPDGFEVRHIRAPGQIDIDLDLLTGRTAKR